jgi:cytochrome c-type biogenesis protein CcsB
MPFLTLCIVTGAFWAENAWGTYWSWDPKETWSLITWLIYTSYLHARLMANWRGKKAACLSVAGFLAVIFTFFGVNLLLPGLHSYR